jgi:hypothetical protein
VLTLVELLTENTAKSKEACDEKDRSVLSVMARKK